VKLKREDSLKEQRRHERKTPLRTFSKWAAASAIGLFSLVSSPGQFLNTGAPIPLAFTN
jgi:hypothetical protein